MPRGKQHNGKIPHDLTDVEIATRDRVLKILTVMAENGSVSAATALERALRHKDAEEARGIDSAIDAILDGAAEA